MGFRNILLILCSSFLLSCTQGDPELQDTQGHVVQFSKLRGHWIIINYWASWCHNCIQEISELNRFYQHNQDKNILLYGVNFSDATPDNLAETVNKTGIAFPVLTENPSQLLNLSEPEAIPMTYIINPEGKVVKVILGASTEKTLTDILHALQQER